MSSLIYKICPKGKSCLKSIQKRYPSGSYPRGYSLCSHMFEHLENSMCDNSSKDGTCPSCKEIK